MSEMRDRRLTGSQCRDRARPTARRSSGPPLSHNLLQGCWSKNFVSFRFLNLSLKPEPRSPECSWASGHKRAMVLFDLNQSDSDTDDEHDEYYVPVRQRDDTQRDDAFLPPKKRHMSEWEKLTTQTSEDGRAAAPYSNARGTGDRRRAVAPRRTRTCRRPRSSTTSRQDNEHDWDARRRKKPALVQQHVWKPGDRCEAKFRAQAVGSHNGVVVPGHGRRRREERQAVRHHL